MSVAVLLGLPQAAALAGQQPIPVPGAVIYPGQAMDEAALVDKLFHVPEGSEGNFAISRSQLKGLYAKRALLPGKPIALSHLKPREAVTPGGPVRAVYDNGGVSITTLLVPLQAGAVGDYIDARNPQSGAIVKARIAENGTLEVGP
jgi:flagella basal body P-ring formation protein FlgA